MLLKLLASRAMRLEIPWPALVPAVSLPAVSTKALFVLGCRFR
jgi:hypothetical protein